MKPVRTARPPASSRAGGVRRGTAAAPVRLGGIRMMDDVRTATDLVRPVTRAPGGRGGRMAAVGHIFDRRFVQLVKFAEIGQLATGIIHEINSPFACLRSNCSVLSQYVQSLVDRIPASTRAHRARAKGRCAPNREDDVDDLLCNIRQVLEDIAASSDLVTSIARNLKSLAYSVYDAPKETDLHTCIEVALRVAGHELKYRVRVEKDFGALPLLKAYPGLLIQVFLNLFVNAAQAIDGEGVLRIRTRCDGTGILVEVSDTGSGIAPQHLSRIFRPFFTTKPVGVGLGLGLSMCKRIIERHGGKIRVSSSPGQGTTFRIRLPFAVREARHAPGRLPSSVLTAPGARKDPR